MLVDDVLPDHDVHLVRSVLVNADAHTTFDAIEEPSLREDPLLRGVSWIRSLPTRALSFFEGTPPEPEEPAWDTIGELFDADGCVRLAEDPGRELVVGAAGKFWDPREPVREGLTRETFAAFDEPGHARGVLDITVHPRGSERCLLVLEARAKGTDEDSSQALSTFASFVKPAAGLIAQRALDTIKAHAETGATDLPEPTRAEVAAATGQIPEAADADLEGHRVLLRTDLGPIVAGQDGTQRIDQAASTIEQLIDRNAGVVVLGDHGPAEQARSLDEIGDLLADQLDRDVDVTDSTGKSAAQAARKVNAGEVLVLGNVREANGELVEDTAKAHAERRWVRELSQSTHVFVNDALSACLPEHASTLGFPELMPSVAGPSLVDELEALETLVQQDEPRVLALGGAKPAKRLDLIAHQLTTGRADGVLAGGLVGLMFLEADGVDTGEGTRSVLEDHGVEANLRQARAILQEHEDKIRLPTDVAIERSGERLNVPVDDLPAKGRVKDIGPETATRFADRLADADAVLAHGPMGVLEETQFGKGTHQVMARAGQADAFTVVGGGHTVHALDEDKVDPDGFDHVSLSGGALLPYLAGENLPSLDALEA
jgi:phosphoglycerate kinase